MKSICVYCGSGEGVRPAYAGAAREVGRLLARRGLGMVYGGGRVGLMGITADAALAAGGRVTGVIPRALLARELGHEGVGDLRVVSSMHERKALMAELSDAFIALPGGFGTWEEICEILTWTQLGLHRKPAGFLNVEGYYDRLLDFFRHAAAEGFIAEKHLAAVVSDTDPERLLEKVLSAQPPPLPQWIRPDET